MYSNTVTLPGPKAKNIPVPCYNCYQNCMSLPWTIIHCIRAIYTMEKNLTIYLHSEKLNSITSLCSQYDTSLIAQFQGFFFILSVVPWVQRFVAIAHYTTPIFTPLVKLLQSYISIYTPVQYFILHLSIIRLKSSIFINKEVKPNHRSVILYHFY